MGREPARRRWRIRRAGRSRTIKILSYKKNRYPASVWRNPVHFFAFGLGSGCVPWAPGTLGSAAAMLPYLLLSQLSLAAYLLVLAVSFALGIWLCGKTTRDIGVHDHSGIVWDEFVGYWITMLAAPAGWPWMLAGLLLFRVFDVLKPFPVSWFDRHLGGGFGVMFDDAIAAAYAWFCLQGLAFSLGASIL